MPYNKEYKREYYKKNKVKINKRKRLRYQKTKHLYERACCVDCGKKLGINSINGKAKRCKKCNKIYCIGNKTSGWKGGRLDNGYGYIYVWNKKHPRRNSKGYVLEHRLVMERHLGRYLHPSEEVHHINGKKSDNRLGNLFLFPNRASHVSFHRRKKCE